MSGEAGSSGIRDAGDSTRRTDAGGAGGSAGGLDARIFVRRSATFTLEFELSLPPGRTVALLGPNGAGKSTAVASLAGLLPIDAGRIVLGGTVLDDPAQGTFVPAEDRSVGVVFQDGLLFPHMSVRDNVEFGLRSRGVPRDEARQSAERWIDRIGLTGLAERTPGELSGGQAQRAALARALATDPSLLLLDEPLSALDVSGRAELRRALEVHLADYRGPRLLITHDPAEAFQLADEVQVLEEGRVTQVGTAEEIRMRPRTAYAADLAGSNLMEGYASDGVVETGGHALSVADREARGPVRVSIRPTAVAVHREAPGGSPRNRWSTVVERVEDHGSRVRILTGAPLPLMIEVTPDARRELGLGSRAEVWISVKATDIGVEELGEGAE